MARIVVRRCIAPQPRAVPNGSQEPPARSGTMPPLFSFQHINYRCAFKGFSAGESSIPVCCAPPRGIRPATLRRKAIQSIPGRGRRRPRRCPGRGHADRCRRRSAGRIHPVPYPPAVSCRLNSLTYNEKYALIPFFILTMICRWLAQPLHPDPSPGGASGKGLAKGWEPVSPSLPPGEERLSCVSSVAKLGDANKSRQMRILAHCSGGDWQCVAE